MIKYSIMAFMFGYTGNKLFNKKDQTTATSIKIGVISAVSLIILDIITITI